jgi:hypothetical protein
MNRDFGVSDWEGLRNNCGEVVTGFWGWFGLGIRAICERRAEALCRLKPALLGWLVV